MRLNKLAEAEHWYRESLRAKPDHIPAHLTYGKLLAMTVRTLEQTGPTSSFKCPKVGIIINNKRFSTVNF